MESAANLVADRVALESIIRRRYPEIEEITYINHGHDNLVVCVNGQAVFRFPRNDQAARRLQFEVALLQFLKGKVTALPIPELLEVSAAPLYVVTTYREGISMDASQIGQLTDEEQTAIGQTLAQFIVEFSSAISSDQLMQLRKQAGLIGMDEPWPEYFERLFVLTPLPNQQLQPIINEYYTLWKSYVEAELATFSIHDDLHPANILFTGSSISAVLDFGDANVGSIEEEMRGLYRLGDQVLRAGLARLHELTGHVVAYDHVRVWVIMNDLATFVRYLSDQRTDHPQFLRAQSNLKQWIPNFPL